MVTLEVANAFKSIKRDCMLQAVQSLCPAIYCFVYSELASPSNLLLGDHSISSAESVQQGVPLRPLLFYLTLHGHSLQLRSKLNVGHLDNVTLGGDYQYPSHDLSVMSDASDLGLTLNSAKCHDMTTCGPFYSLTSWCTSGVLLSLSSVGFSPR